MLQALQSNPALLYGVIWAIVTSLASLVAPKVAATSAWHHVAAFLAGLGIDLPKAGASLTAAVQAALKAALKVPPAASAVLLAGALTGSVFGTVEACKPLPAQTATDAESATKCLAVQALTNQACSTLLQSGPTPACIEAAILVCGPASAPLAQDFLSSMGTAGMAGYSRDAGQE